MPPAGEIVRDWLPPGKRAAVCFTIDDVHPGKSSEHYDAGGDLGRGALGLVADLLNRHPDAHVTLFTTADWREISPTPSRVLSRIPIVRDQMYLSRVLPAGTRRIDRHPEFLAYVKAMPRTEIGLHGLHHIHPGRLLHVEFQDEPVAEHRAKLQAMLEVFDASCVPYVRGMCPPGWNAPAGLLAAMDELDFEFVASARDIKTDISADAVTDMSGLRGCSLIYPTRLAGRRLVHFATNFQATSRWERARAIIEAGGLLAIKAHIIKDALGYVALDGIDGVYCNFLDLLFERLRREYGDALWWTTMGQVAARVRQATAEKAS
jgi:predicted deacetylase